jgi:nucleotide-binding universal stress UspA family protein
MSGILFATDFSATSDAAGRIAREAARQANGAVLHIVHVVPPVTDPFDSGERLAEVAAALRDAVPVTTELLHGRPGRQIVDYACRHKIGLIVVGTHGRTGVSRALLGSVAEAVVRLAPCPVLTVPPASLDGATAYGVVPQAIESSRSRCLICAGGIEEDELVCEPCRTRVRAAAPERKIEAERLGRR